MTDGLFFYWIGWMFWIILVFIYKPSRTGKLLSIWLLLIISGSNIYVTIDTLALSISFIFLFLGSIIAHVHIQNRLYHLFASFSLAIGYTSMLIWEQNMPVWLFMPKIVMTPLIMAILLLIVTRTFRTRLVVGLLDLSYGEAMYRLIMYGYHVSETIGEMAFFDHTMALVLVLFIINLMQKVKTYMLSTTKQMMRWQHE